MKRILLATVAAALSAASVLGAPNPAVAASSGSWTVNSPSGSGPAAVVTLTNGQLSFAAQRGGSTVLSAPIGITTSVGDFSKGLNFENRSDSVMTQSYTMVTGKQRSRDAAYNETSLSFTGANGAAANLVVAAGQEGVAYRWVLPETGTIQVSSDSAGWRVPNGSPAWLNDFAADYQGQWRTTTSDGAPSGTYAYPALFDVGGTYVSIAESDLDGRYSATELSHNAGSGTYTCDLEDQVSSSGPLSTPWRVAAVGDLGTIFSSRIVDDLASPSKVSDTSWIKPGQVAWSWLTQGTGDENLQKQYVDFAAQNGWPYDLVDAGWDASWVPDLVSYAKARNVGILLWYDSSNLQTDAQLQQLQQAKDWGVAGVKIDYVFNHTQPTLQWYDKVLSLTADLHLMVNFHGTEAPRGMQRTWPQVLTSEAVYGAEQKQDSASFDTILPFTRNQLSSMDFTPVDFSTAMGDTTMGHQVGMAVAFESGWQHYSDNPAGYNSQPLALAVLDKTPTVWDESRLLGGVPGQEVYMARRYGSSWYVGGLSAVGAKTFTTGLGFLGSGQYFAETVRDDGQGGLTRNTSTVTSANTLSVPEATNGGFVSIICPATPGITACPNPSTGPVSGNDFSVSANPASGSATAGSTATLAVSTGVAAGTAESVTLSATGLPTGTSASFNPGSVTAGGSSTLTITTSASTPSGTYAVTITGTSISATHTAPYKLTVTGGSGGGTLNGTHTLTVAGKALDDPNHSTTPGTQLITWTPNGGPNQSWVFVEQLDGSYQITNSESGLCMDVFNASTAAGAQVIQWTCNNQSNQRWIVTPLSGGAYTIASQSSRLLLTTAGTSDGSLITQQADTGTNLEHWTIA